MFGSVILDTAIGLAFLYLLLSLLVTGINELIESRLKWRAKNLELGIQQLLDSKPMVKQLYDHPLIYSLFDGDFQSGSRKLPCYIPARSFALALLDIAVPSTGANTSGTAGCTPSHATAARAAAVSANVTPAPSPGTGGTVAPGVAVEVTVPTPATAPAAPPANAVTGPLQDLRTGVQNSALSPNARRALVSLIDAAGNDMAQVRRNIEDWFDGTMDRVSGWYKRQIQWITFFVGIGIAVMLNADTFAVADSLARDPALRTSIAAAAEADVKARAAIPAKPDESSVESVTKGINDVRGLGWPIGWVKGDKRTVPCGDGREWAWVLKVIGWLVTAFAITLGAPFWFDTLNRFIIIRSTVRPKEKSPNEPPVNPMH